MVKTKKEKINSSKKKNTNKKEKKGNFFNSVKLEIKKVVWPDKKDIVKYTIATLIFCIVVMIFFQLLDLGLSVIKGVIN